MKLKLEGKFSNDHVFAAFINDPEYVKAEKAYELALTANDLEKIDDSMRSMELIVCDILYKKAFHDGMRFILDTMSGKEVIDL